MAITHIASHKQVVHIDPADARGPWTIKMPINPENGWYVTIKTTTLDPTPITLDGNGKNIYSVLAGTSAPTILFPITGGSYRLVFNTSQDTWFVMTDNRPTALSWPTRGVWTPPHGPNEVVHSQGWSMVANTFTTDPPHPVPVGDPLWLSGLGDTPAWTKPTASASTLLRGMRFKPTTNAAYAISARIWAEEPTTEYATILITRRGQPDQAESFGEWRTYAGAPGWVTVNLGGVIVRTGFEYDYILATRSNITPTTTQYNYDYKRENGDPDAGIINHQDNGWDMRIAHEDQDGVDRQAFLEAMNIGDQISFGGITWTIQAIDLQADHVRFTVTPTSRAQENNYDVSFIVYAPEPVTYVEVANQLLGNAEVRGIAGDQDSDLYNLPEDDNAYACDWYVQRATISPDWDLLAYSDL